MTKFEHPFAKICRAVLKEKFPDRAAAIPDGFPLAVADILEDVIDEALKRYNAGKKTVIYTPFIVRHANTAQKQKITGGYL
jgi:hypothetical protein